jgi:hypothetical protein
MILVWYWEKSSGSCLLTDDDEADDVDEDGGEGAYLYDSCISKERERVLLCLCIYLWDG